MVSMPFPSGVFQSAEESAGYEPDYRAAGYKAPVARTRCHTLIRSPTDAVSAGPGSAGILPSRGKQPVANRMAPVLTALSVFTLRNVLSGAGSNAIAVCLLRRSKVDREGTVPMQLDDGLGLRSTKMRMARRREDIVAGTIGLHLAPIGGIARCEQERTRKHR
jgi:hypothetical protein